MKLSAHLRNHAMECTLAARSDHPVDLNEHARLFGGAAWAIDKLQSLLARGCGNRLLPDENFHVVHAESRYSRIGGHCSCGLLEWLEQVDKALEEKE